MASCSFPGSGSTPWSFASSQSRLNHLASPPFSSLPLSPPSPGELYTFDHLPPLLPGISTPLVKPSQARRTGGSISSCSSHRSYSSGSMSAHDSLRQSISSMASSSLRSISEGSPSHVLQISTREADDDFALSIGRQANTAHPLLLFAEEKDWPECPSDEVMPLSLLDRLRPLARANTLLSINSRKYRPESRERASEYSPSISSSRVIVQREQTTVSQTIDRDDTESHQDFISQTAAWKMMQADCRAEQVFGDINTILGQAPFATSCSTPTIPTHCRSETPPPSMEARGGRFDEAGVARWTNNQAAKKSGSALGSLVTRFRKRSNRSSQVSITSPLQTAPSPRLGPTASEDELKQATRILGLSWGCEARKLWDADCGQHNATSRTSAAFTVESSVEGEVVEGWTLERDESHLQHWSTFYKAYSQGQLDLSVTPVIPKGVPDINFCPMATPAGGPGRLEAPTPDWEVLRARAFCRLELDRLSKQSLKDIAEKVTSCLMAVHVRHSVLHCLQGDAVLRLTAKGLQIEREPRQQSLCAHTILNSNRGMMIHDIATDWRFEKPDGANHLRYYAGMPVVAANGLPIAILSLWDAQRDFSIEPQFLKRTAREIGQIFEEHYRKRWESKVCKMTRSVELLQNRLLQGINVPWSSEAEDICFNNFSDLEALSVLGVLMSIEDVTRLQWTLREMASLLDLETMYLAAICLNDGDGDKTCNSSKQRVLLLAHHNLPSSKLSFMLHRGLFSGTTNDSNHLYLRQNNCMSSQSLNAKPGSEPFTGGNTGMEAMLILPIAERGDIGFVLGAMTHSKTKVIGIEDLRYMEALRPSFCAAIDKFIRAASHPAQTDLDFNFAPDNPTRCSSVSS